LGGLRSFFDGRAQTIDQAPDALGDGRWLLLISVALATYYSFTWFNIHGVKAAAMAEISVAKLTFHWRLGDFLRSRPLLIWQKIVFKLDESILYIQLLLALAKIVIRANKHLPMPCLPRHLAHKCNETG
jgi:hypothetical protein